jgi:hypothetical protein
MKTIFNDPVSWAQRAAGSKLALIFMICGHIAGFFILDGMLWYSELPKYYMPPVFMVSLIFGVFFPAMYLYALHQMLKLVDTEKSE